MKEWIDTPYFAVVKLDVPDKLRGHLDRDAIHNSLTRSAERRIRKDLRGMRYKVYHQQVTTEHIEDPRGNFTRYVLRSCAVLSDGPSSVE